MSGAQDDNTFDFNAIKFGSFYEEVDPAALVEGLDDVDARLDQWRKTSQAERLFWDQELMDRIRGARVLEIGGGSGWCTLLMLQSGAAHVTLQEITPSTERLATEAARLLGAEDRLTVKIGNPMELDFGEQFDVVVGHLVFHHIPTEIEVEFARMMARNTTDKGWMRIVDPAVNWRALDDLRWALPAPGRPSKFSKKWAAWKAQDEHPDRDNSTPHVTKVFEQAYSSVRSEPTAGLSRLHRWVDSEKYHDRALEWLNRLDTKLPQSLQQRIAAQHVITAERPIRDT